MCSNIEIGGYAYRYLCNTSSRTDLNYLQGVDGAIGRCFTLISDAGERTFAISPGHMNKLRPESIPEEVIAGASALVLTSYLVRCKPGEPMPDATMKAIEYAKKHDVPVLTGWERSTAKRKTQHPLLPGAIAEFNQYEFSRAMRHQDCVNLTDLLAYRAVHGWA
jgi:sugar/nucleoside kinase (ribokinase family)